LSARRTLALMSPKSDVRPILATAPLRIGFERANLSRYDDPSWDLGPAVFRENARRCHVTVHFSAVKDPTLAAALRAYLYARLNVYLPGVRPLLPPASVRQAFNRCRRFLDFVMAETGAFDLGQATQATIDRYAKHLRAGGVRPIVVAQLLEVIFDLHTYRAHLGPFRLPFEPWPGRSTSIVAGYRSRHGENATPRIPESVIGPLVAWSIKYVTIFAKDILAAREELTELEDRRDEFRAVDARLTDPERRRLYSERLVSILAERHSRGRGVPMWTHAHNGTTRTDPRTGNITPPVNAPLLHLYVGIDAQKDPEFHLLLSSRVKVIEEAIARFGVEVGGMDTPISRDPETGGPWRPRFDAKTLVHEERMLQAACYVLCAYLTGMRDCEVQAMRSDCLQLTRSADGVIERHRIRSTAYKNKAPRGETAEWVTIPPVADAVAVLEKLSRRAAVATETDTLWPVLAYERSNKVHVSAEIVRQLNVYRDHLNALFGSEDKPAVPPGPDGKPWRITTRQFRRTIAWYIANRPFGTIAGMIQYKHASVAAFEGYAGSSASGFRAEVDAQRALGQIEDILEYFDQRQDGVQHSGPAGPRVARALEAIAEELGELPAKAADRRRLRTMLTSLARTLHVGVLADCFFDPSTALCLKNTGEKDQTGPLVALCQPTRCPNACITARHLEPWDRAAAEAKELLREGRLPTLQRIALKEDLERIEAVVRGIPQTSTDVGGVRDVGLRRFHTD
jgi:integrase